MAVANRITKYYIEWLTTLLEYLNLKCTVFAIITNVVGKIAFRWLMGNKELINVGLNGVLGSCC